MAIARVAQPDGTWIVYEPGDDIPSDFFGGGKTVDTRYISVAEYRARFTEAELLAMLGSADPYVQLLILKTSTAPPEGVDLLSPMVAGGLAYLVADGFLAADRPAQIMA